MLFGATEVLWKGKNRERPSRPPKHEKPVKKNHGRAAAKWPP